MRHLLALPRLTLPSAVLPQLHLPAPGLPARLTYPAAATDDWLLPVAFPPVLFGYRLIYAVTTMVGVHTVIWTHS